MKRFYKVKGGFTRMSDSSLLVHAHTVIQALRNNYFFTSLASQSIELEAATFHFENRLSHAGYKGSSLDTALKNESRKKLMRIMKELAFFVNKIAEGSLIILLSSGLKISYYRKRTNVPKTVVDLRLKDGYNAGQIVLSFQSQANVRLYEYKYSTEMNENGLVIWPGKKYITTSSRNNLIALVVPGQYYFISVRAINTRGISDWCEPVQWMAR